MSAERTLADRRREKPPTRVVRVDVVNGPDMGRSRELPTDDPLAVGSADGNALVLSDRKVSRYHLELAATEGGVRVTDLGSLNGTWIGLVRVQQAIVPAGTRLALGDTLLEVRDASVPDAGGEGTAPVIPGFVAHGRAMRRIAIELARLGPSMVSVLVQGETGTGKEVVARALHGLSPRRDRPFVVVDCGSLPATLVASELFGHERGAFTGADRKRAGAFERGHGGTVFLDEIGELPLAVQPALLGVLERRQFRTVGGDREIDVDVRVVAATHRDLRAAVNLGTFRADLYYRLAVARVVVPPLRERPEDVEPLVLRFAREVLGQSAELPFSEETMEALRRHPWAGNVRELRNVVESALAMGRVQLEDDVPAAAQPSPSAATSSAVDASAAAISGATLGPYADARAQAVERFERDYLVALTTRFGANASQAARFAGMDRNYLVSLLRKHGLR
ncbi:MAG: sigma 54-dependent Fis family transcriptional regulator [Deltaproteobacteria bacterium]|nr:sigma 54-dependent Fis family transcriptional regulator [Deltaproteobacteria bacterium]